MNQRKGSQLEMPFDFDDKGSTIPIDPPIEEKPLSDFCMKLKQLWNSILEKDKLHVR